MSAGYRCRCAACGQRTRESVRIDKVRYCPRCAALLRGGGLHTTRGLQPVKARLLQLAPIIATVRR